MPQDTPRCVCRSLSKSYGRKTVLDNCDLDIAAGEIVGLVGENGSGKSTLLRCLLGFTRPTSGRSWVCASAGYCPQDNYLDRQLTIREHFRLLSKLYRLHHETQDSFLQSLVERLNLLHFLDVEIGQLSSGTYQKVKFATSILARPDLLVLDEPTDGFDWKMYLAFWDLMVDVRAWNGAVLLVSHLVHDRHRFDRILEMKDGRCTQAR